MNNTTKSPLQSKGVIGGVVAAIATLLQTFGVIEVTPEEQQSIVAGVIAFSQLGGAFMAIYGRIVAKYELKF